MLTRTHLALLRAALQYFDEEMSPHGTRVMRPYFDEPLAAEFAKGEIRQLRERLQKCKLAYVRCDTAAMTLTTTKLSLSWEDLDKDSAGQTAEIATILFLPQD